MAARLAILAALALAGRADATPDARFLIMPPPRDISAHGDARALSRDFSILLSGVGASSALARDAAAREDVRWRAAVATSAPVSSSSPLLFINVSISSDDESLDAKTDYSYSLHAAATSDVVTITAHSCFGAMAGLTSLRHLLARGGGAALPFSDIHVTDAPDWGHRGLMIDAGRRFFPVSLVRNLLDSMALIKLNLLHLHVSDECRFGIESLLFPGLTARLTGDYGGFYTQDDVRGLVTYATARGVRVMLEIDVPGHSRGLLPLASYGAVFCDPSDATCSQLYGDPANKTFSVVTQLLGEMVALFPEPVVHIGCDETGVVGVCTVASTFAVERLILDYLQNTLKKTPAGWEEVLFDASAATPQTVVYAWSRHDPESIIKQGYTAVDNNASHFYLTRPGGVYPAGWELFHYDIGAGLSPAEKALMQGGEMSQWTDTYCITDQCGASNGPNPVASSLFPPSKDAAFATSIGGMIFPRAIVGAASFWAYNASTSSQDPAFVASVWATNDMIVAAGGVTCPSRCECDQLTQCGSPIVPLAPPSVNMSLHVSACSLPLPPTQAFSFDAASGSLTVAGKGAVLCVANPAGGSGNPTYPLKLSAVGSADCVKWTRTGGAARVVDQASSGCLDLALDGTVGIYDCGSDSDLEQLNQAWAIDAQEPGVYGAVLSWKSDGSGGASGCLTAA